MSYELQGGRKTTFTITVPLVELTWDKKLLRRVMAQAGRVIANTAKAKIGSGTWNKARTSAAPGSPPMNVTGMLRKSIKVSAKGLFVTIADQAQSGSAAYYALFLEDGTRGGGGRKGSKNIGRVKRKGAFKGIPQTGRVTFKHPFLSTAIEEELPTLQKQIQVALSKGIDLKQLKGGKL